MATTSKKKGDKKSSKKAEEATISVQESKDSIPIETEQPTPCPETPAPVNLAPEQPPEPEIPPPEIVYEEPILTKLIVERYEGSTSKGLYDGDGEAYYAGGHHYQGQFQEGFMHGKGVYTWADGVRYEGEFVKNAITGCGIYKWQDGSSYEGQLVNGRYHGFGVFRLPDGQRSYAGEWCLGQKHGKGLMAYDAEGRSYYNGDWVNNIKQGYGKRQYPSGNVYEGMWFANIRQGEGVMKWYDRSGNLSDLYSGLWENGEQHGFGHHIWFVRRAASSQYPLRNMYTGDFFHGRRQGFGVFVYANGARYEGQWIEDKKHGKGKFVFKNGRVYEGVFKDDRTVEYPDLDLATLATPDQNRIRTRTPLPREEHSSAASIASANTFSPSLQLQLDYLLRQLPEADRDEELHQLTLAVTRHMTGLRRVYAFYSCLGCLESNDRERSNFPDNTYVMSRLQLWRCLKDIRLHHEEDFTLVDMDCLLAAAAEGSGDQDIHSPASTILFREFLHFIVVLAYHIYHEKHAERATVLSHCLDSMMAEKITKYACTVKGYIYADVRRTFHVQNYLDRTYDIFKQFIKPRKRAPHDRIMTMRQFLFLMKDLKLINADLTAKAFVDILASDEPKLRDPAGAINMELEITFLEFFEALVGSAEVYVTEAVRKEPNSPPRSAPLTTNQSVASFYGIQSREASQFGMDEASGANLLDDGATSPDGAETPGGHSASRSRAEIRQRPEVLGSMELTSDGEGTTRKIESPVKDVPQDANSRLSEVHGGLVQSTASVRADFTDDENLGFGEEEQEMDNMGGEELDENVKQFNDWTYQIHIFFAKKFFPAAQRFSEICEAVIKSNAVVPAAATAPTPVPVPVETAAA